MVEIQQGEIIMTKKITYSSRKLLEQLITNNYQKGCENTYQIWQIANKIGCSDITIYKELKLGLSEEDYYHRCYSNYRADVAQKRKEEILLARERR